MLGISGAREFRLSPTGDPQGVSCDATGVFIGPVSLLQRRRDASGRQAWHPRDTTVLNEILSASYGLPIDFAAKVGGLAAIAQALNRGDVALAQVSTLLLRLPALPSLAKGAVSLAEITDLALRLCESGIFKGEWDPETRDHQVWSGKVGGSRQHRLDSSPEARTDHLHL